MIFNWHSSFPTVLDNKNSTLLSITDWRKNLDKDNGTPADVLLMDPLQEMTKLCNQSDTILVACWLPIQNNTSC